MAISMADVKELREKTGAGMLDVRKALEEASGDKEKALEIIRVKGLKGIAKREGRSTSFGLVDAEIVDDGTVGVMVEVNSETDFVAKTDKFIDLASNVLAAAVKERTSDVKVLLDSEYEGESVQSKVDGLQAIIGEKIVVNRVAAVEGEAVACYLHRTAKDLPPTVGVLVATDKAGSEVARDIAMHIAAYSPKWLSSDDVPADIVEQEKHIAEETAINEGKPEKALPKIIEGRVNGFFKENVLLNQPYARDPKMTVAGVLDGVKGSVTAFVRFRVGSE